MSMITEKRNEVANRLNELLAERKRNIEIKVNAYKVQLEAEPISEEIINTKKLLVALDEVISCENKMVEAVKKHTEERNSIIMETINEALTKSVETVVKESTPEVSINIAETNIKAVEEVDTIPAESEIVDFVEITVDPETKEAEVTTPIAEARPGMAYVGIPERR